MVRWEDIDDFKFQEEKIAAAGLQQQTRLDTDEIHTINAQAVDYVSNARTQTQRKGLMETFLEEFGLSNNEGLALMCLAESLLRVPDAPTADKLIAEKIQSGAWDSHQGHSESWLVNASTLGLILTGQIVDIDAEAKTDISAFMHKMTRQLGEPVIRAAMMQAMRILGEQFVVGRTIDAAIHRTEQLGLDEKPGLCSFDMLGEGARTHADATRYHGAYLNAIQALHTAHDNHEKITFRPEDAHGISVKLSALHPRYNALHEDQVMTKLYPSLLQLAVAAAQGNINFCMDAEEVDRLVPSLKILDKLVHEPELQGWNGLGLAVQAYQKRARVVCRNLIKLARETNCRLMIRLVKGAYWDSEIKHAQIAGHEDYPVWTRKSTTDLSYLACARSLLDAGPVIYPQFATHNAHTIAAIQHMAGADAMFEFQRLHGMGEALYRAVAPNRPIRIYAPVGAHKDLLPYLVRRLLENGANTSFVHSFLDANVPPENVARSPFSSARPTRHERIPLPADMFGEERPNSKGLDLFQRGIRLNLENEAANINIMAAAPIIDGKPTMKGLAETVLSPTTNQPIGSVIWAQNKQIDKAYAIARQGFASWNAIGGAARAEILYKVADALESQRQELICLMAAEAGKCLADGINEAREAVDFIRYYAHQAETLFQTPETLPSPAGETNQLKLTGRGVFVCISPWNFPLAIFTGQIMAALAAGNTVLAKPAEQTPLTAFKTVQIFLAAGLPKEVLQLLPGMGETVGTQLVNLPNLAGVCFTGSITAAQTINRSLAAKNGPIPVLIAETGGLNGMFVDTTALREQVIDDVIQSAFNAAGQRCSALRILFLPEETADQIIEGLEGAMDSLEIGNPALAKTDVGPVIDQEALDNLQNYVANLPASLKLRKQCTPPTSCKTGNFMPPTLIEADSLADINHETFGPVLHVIRYKQKMLNQMAQAFASKDYGLTLGIHSRLEQFAETIQQAVPAGNTYINRNMIGAVVGVQPFGGLGLSGTGPKAGGPHYMMRFATEITVTNNITAQGGDPALLNLDE